MFGGGHRARQPDRVLRAGNAARFHLQDAIWRGEYYTPTGPQYSGMAHFDHVHLTTYGGGYPAGGEIYYR